jgi:hypothetical protein
MQQITGFKTRIKSKSTTLILFAYGIVAGGAAPLILSRCGAGCSGCGACGTVFLGIIPLLVFMAFKTRLKNLSKLILFWRKGE